jgi:serine/threonine protein kinase
MRMERLEHEYALRAELDSDWAARPLNLARREGRLMLILEDPGGEPLDRLLGESMGLSRFLRLAVGLAAALGKLHQEFRNRRDPADWFRYCFTSSARRQSPEPPEVIAGTLAYMTPEQTGRMNRSIHSRSDLYSLGVTFYEMLTGALPFKASDPTGSKPAGFVHPLAIRAMEGIGIDISGRRSKHLGELQVPPHCQQDDLRLKLPPFE